MVAAVDFCVNLCVRELVAQAVGEQKIVDTPSGIFLSCPEAVRPPRVSYLFGIKRAETIHESIFQKLCHLGSFLVGETGILTICLWILEVYLLMSYVQVAANDNGLDLVKFVKVGLKVIFPSHPIIQTTQSVLRIGCIDSHKIEAFHFKRYHTAFMVVLVNTQSVSNAQRFMLGEYRCA